MGGGMICNVSMGASGCVTSGGGGRLGGGMICKGGVERLGRSGLPKGHATGM
jgi:hypothetical protein